MRTLDVEVSDGKYRVIQEDGRLSVLRYNELWMSSPIQGSNMIIAMACEIEELREKVKKHDQ